MFVDLGELPAEQISWMLQETDIGLATTPWPVIEKSSSAAAFLDHGIPVLVSREDSTFRRVPSDPAVPLDRAVRLRDLVAGRRELPAKVPPRSRLPAVAGEFLRALADAA